MTTAAMKKPPALTMYQKQRVTGKGGSDVNFLDLCDRANWRSLTGPKSSKLITMLNKLIPDCTKFMPDSCEADHASAAPPADGFF